MGTVWTLRRRVLFRSALVVTLFVEMLAGTSSWDQRPSTLIYPCQKVYDLASASKCSCARTLMTCSTGRTQAHLQGTHLSPALHRLRRLRIIRKLHGRKQVLTPAF